MKRTISIILLINIFLTKLIFSQTPNTDSLILQLQTVKSDTAKISLFLKIGNGFLRKNPDSSILFLEKGLKLSEEIESKEFMSASCRSIAEFYSYKDDYTKALDYYEKALELNIKSENKQEIAYLRLYMGLIQKKQGNYSSALYYYEESLNTYESLNDTTKMAECYNNLGAIYDMQGDYNKALKNYQKSLSYCEKANIEQGIPFCLNNIGLIHQKQGNLDNALKYFERTLGIFEENKNPGGIANANISIGLLFVKKKMYDKALQHLEKSLLLMKELNIKRGTLYCLGITGDAYKLKGDYEKALELYLESIELSEKLGDRNIKVQTLKDLADVYNNIADSATGFQKKKQNYSIAVDYALQSLNIAQEMEALPKIKDNYAALNKAYAGLHNYKSAYEYSQKYIAVNDSLFNKEKTKAIEEMEAKYQTEKKQQEIEKQKLVIEKKEAENKKKDMQRNAFIVGFVLMLGLAFVSYRSFKRKKRDNKIINLKNAELEQANEEILVQRDTLQVQKDKIENIHKQLKDSIQYAKRIQKAAMPTQDILDSMFDDYFVFFKPLHIVSGDFFWAKKIGKMIAFTAADSTGHGVPGAFVSMLGISLLNEIVQRKNVTQANQVLELMREEVKSSLKQTGEINASKDGMDMALCVFDTESNKLQFSGAYNSLYLFRNNELQEYKATRNPIAVHMKEVDFKNYSIDIEDGDVIYMFSDGFPDQYGGEKNRKFMKKRFKNMLQEVHHKPMKEQKQILNNTLESWKGKTEQTDDILVFGVKFHFDN